MARTCNQTIISSWLAKCPKWRGCLCERFVSATGRVSFYEMVSAASSLPTKIPFPRTETTAHHRVLPPVAVIVQKSRHLVRSPKTGNIRIRRAGFWNQNSLFELDSEKVFFAPGRKIVLQDYPPESRHSSAPSREHLRSCRRSRASELTWL